MRRSYPGGKSSVFYIGKGIIISSLVITSLLSFILGFFVGKNLRHSGTDQAAFVTPTAETAAGSKEAEIGEVPSQQPQEAVRVQTAEPQKPPEPPATPVPDNPQESPGKKELQQPVETKHNEGSPGVKKHESAPKAGKSNSAGTARELARVTYTVQIGAFRNSSEADSLQSKFVKKGYKGFITTSKKNDKPLYRVMIGEFHHRKDAELLSVRIRKKEGLRTFVTLKRD
jgi:cell division protein FtsN